MATKKIIKTIFQFRRATFAEWEANRPIIPADGEPCFILDQNILKIGDGKTEFGDLVPINGVKVEIAADEKSIVVEDNIFKLFGFSDAEAGAQPRKNSEGVIEWVVPTDVTGFDDIKKDVAALKTDVSGLQSEVKTLQDIIGEVEGEDPLLTRVAKLETGVEVLNGADTVEGSVKQIVKDEINKFATDITANGTIDTFVELVEYVAKHGGEVSDMISGIASLEAKVGEETVETQIKNALKEGNFASADKVESLQDIVNGIALSYLSEDKANAVFEQKKYEITGVPVGTLVDYREKEIRVMAPANAAWTKQSVGAGGNANYYYMTLNTYAPAKAVGYVEHIGGESDAEILTDIKTDSYGRKYQPTWLSMASYDEATATWTYFGAKSTVDKYVGWDYQIDWYDADGVMIASDKIRINLSNEACHNEIAPSYMAGTINKIDSIALGGTVLGIVDKQVNIPIGAGLKGSDEIEIAADGTLRIKVMSWDKLIDGETEIVMDGGSAVK